MMRILLSFVMSLAIAQCFAQKKKDNATVQPSYLSRYNLSDKHAIMFTLPKRISEASGLVMTGDGRLFSHDDERGVVYQLDYKTGNNVKQFSLGKFGVKGDFEDIAVRGKMFYLVESGGRIYEFREGEDGGRVEFKMYDTFLTAKNDVEGLCYDVETDCMLLLCKGSSGKGYHDFKAVYSFSFKTMALLGKPRFLIPLAKASVDGDFQPSAITRHPKSGTFFVIAAQGFSIIELSKEGNILGQQAINKKINPHPEGIAFAPDLTLILCNDGQGKRSSLTLYQPIK